MRTGNHHLRNRQCQPDAPRVCFALSRGEQPVGKHKWCTNHRRKVDNVMAQAKAKKSDPGQLEALRSMLETPEQADEVFREYDANVPSRLAKSQRIPLFDWEAFKRRRGHRIKVKDRQEGVPMEEEEFLRKRVNEKGWSREDAVAKWETMKGDPNVKRDNEGLNNRVCRSSP